MRAYVRAEQVRRQRRDRRAVRLREAVERRRVERTGDDAAVAIAAPEHAAKRRVARRAAKHLVFAHQDARLRIDPFAIAGARRQHALELVLHVAKHLAHKLERLVAFRRRRRC